MSQYDKLCKIDIPKARAQLLKSIAEYRKLATLSSLVEGFFTALQGKRIDVRTKEKLHDFLIEQAPELKVYRVDFKRGKGIMSNRDEYTFTLNLYDMENGERRFMLATREDGTLDIDAALIADRKWTAYADFLESKLSRFAYNAGKFNDMVHALQQMCEEAMPPGDIFPVYPLSSFYHWYQLHV